MAVRSVLLFAVLIGLIVGGGVAGAECALSGGDAEGSATPTPRAADAPGSPGATATDFAKAWVLDDTKAMYLLLSARAQEQYPQEVFDEYYADFSNELTEVSLKATVLSAEPGVASLSVNMATAYFGDFEYTTTLNLSQTALGWAIDWTPMAIHPEMTDGREFRSVIQEPTRGRILDRNGVALAETVDLRFIGLNRSLVTDKAGLETALVAFGFTEEQVDGAFNSGAGQNQRVKVGQVPPGKEDLTEGIRDIPGVILYFESQRVHPLGAAAAHVVGYTVEFTAEQLAQRKGMGYMPGDRTGATGLEATLDERLAGEIGADLQVVDTAGTVVLTVQSRPFVQGADVQTTLDADTLRAAYARLGDRAGAAVVIDPRTNEILALNSSPSFDPDAFERNDSAALAAITTNKAGPLTNRATIGRYSAGSTFKLITGAAGLMFGGYKTTDRLECGSIWYGLDPPRRNWEGAQGNLTIAEGLMRSCNPVFYEIALTLYNDTDGALSDTARMFGFGAETGTVGVNEVAGIVPDAAQKKAKTGEPWYAGDEVNLGIGQGDLLITPLQLANAYSSFLARQLRVPKLLSGEEATVRNDIPLSDEQWNLLMSGLKLVTSPTGTASAAFSLAGYYDFAGKSGTAEDAGSQQHVLFVAMSPAAAPAAVASVVLDEGQSGSIEAGPIARDLVLAAIN
ncbi:MAG: penicillin-binding transpeptidase domain-containing protein [Dehalococcoidia bacterium]